ncbi:alpha/beta hydrolase [Mesorhizobium sp. B1-1-8]|uniref:alpha/beta hydrolase n=1 Tax=Mesorhizobium sp. B1-1-8 TaxID=2589976 RepID=UPI00112E1449|nr:alpha/beta hydrolase [Mesorhizobium sp. B1-1-8]UCI07368.1 alpha/beta fold hydrolase [Mesorhizobium sp. B1-1-8]
MTVYMTFRQKTVGGGVKSPTLLQGDGTTASPSLRDLSEEQFGTMVANRDVLFGVHGFNVSFMQGVCTLGRLEVALSLPSTCHFIAVLWPGDSWLPILNYPFEGSTSIECGRRLASFCNRRLTGAASVSFVTHSLGARLALEAASKLNRRVRSLCLTAGAINDDCLTSEYASAFANTSVVSVLASRRDRVLKLAFPIGDPIADILHPDHRPFASALGYAGPPGAVGSAVPPWQIPDKCEYDHGDYLPPSNPSALFPDPSSRWTKAAEFMNRAFEGKSQTWP